HASCMEVCPTGAIIRTEFNTVFIQQDVCNGCRNCIAACPYGVIGINQQTGTAHKCTLCYDRLQGGLEPACAKACPTQSIQFGPRSGPGTSSSTFSLRGLRPAPMCSGRCCDSRAILGMSRRRESRSWCASPPP